MSVLHWQFEIVFTLQQLLVLALTLSCFPDTETLVVMPDYIHDYRTYTTRKPHRTNVKPVSFPTVTNMPVIVFIPRQNGCKVTSAEVKT